MSGLAVWADPWEVEEWVDSNLIPSASKRAVYPAPHPEAIPSANGHNRHIEPSNPEAIALRTMERKSDRWRYWLYRSITPTMGDWTFLPLPRLLYPAYFIIRPIRFVLMPVRRALAARVGTKV